MLGKVCKRFKVLRQCRDFLKLKTFMLADLADYHPILLSIEPFLSTIVPGPSSEPRDEDLSRSRLILTKSALILSSFALIFEASL